MNAQSGAPTTGENVFGGDLLADLRFRIYKNLELGGFGGVHIGPSYHGANLGGVIRAGGMLRWDFAGDHDSAKKDHWEAYLAALAGVSAITSGHLADCGSSTGTDCSSVPTLSGTGPLFGSEIGVEALLGNGFGVGLYSRYWYSRVPLNIAPPDNTSGSFPKGPLIDPRGDQVSATVGGWEIIGFRWLLGF